MVSGGLKSIRPRLVQAQGIAFGVFIGYGKRSASRFVKRAAILRGCTTWRALLSKHLQRLFPAESRSLKPEVIASPRSPRNSCVSERGFQRYFG